MSVEGEKETDLKKSLLGRPPPKIIVDYFSDSYIVQIPNFFYRIDYLIKTSFYAWLIPNGMFFVRHKLDNLLSIKLDYNIYAN